MLINFESVKFSYGENLILDQVDFTLHENCRAALIGANGEGKTTLLNLIAGRLSPDGGNVLIKSGIKIGYLEQSGGYESQNTVYAEMLKVFSSDFEAIEKLLTLSERVAAAKSEDELKTLSKKIEAVNAYIAAHNSYDAEVKIKTVLNGMGFGDKYERVINTMSGGEKTRLMLARLLLEECDLLILDEPTNHLDMDTLFWLETYLKTFKGGILVVSHDRYFLDKTVTEVFELENKKLNSFSGNYSKYKILKAEQNARLEKEYEKWLEKKAKLQDYIQKNRVRASTASSAQSRIKQLEKMSEPEKPYLPPRPSEFIFGYDFPPYENVLQLENYRLSRGGKILADGINLSVKRGEKLALLGKNGTGKSSLIKDILNGENGVKVGRAVAFAYYDQELKNLDENETVLYEFWGRHKHLPQDKARAALARCGLFEEDMQKKVSSLSGGEKAKLSLCVLEGERANVLLLDEPTNHLDLPSREALERALKEFDGTIIFVSHDRYFISAVADSVAEIEGGKLIKYDGGFEGFEYAKTLEYSEKEKKAEPKKPEVEYRTKAQRAREAQKKELIKSIEKQIENLENEERDIENALSDPKNAADYVLMNELAEKLKGIKLQLDDLYKQYEAVI